ncbi:MAG: hypothetical protein ACOX7J_04845 [Bacillota bacterium]
MKNNLSELLLQVRKRVNEDYLIYKDLLSEKQIAPESWLNMSLLPTLLLLPAVVLGKAEKKEINLASMIEMSYLAQFVHNHAPEKGEGSEYRMSILIGDFLFAAAIKGLVNESQTKWLERMGGVICRMNEGRTVRSSWQDRSYVPVDEKVENLQREYAELSALSGIIGSDLGGLDQESSQLYTAFAFYAGVIQGIVLNGYHEEQPNAADTYCSYCQQYILSLPDALAKCAEEVLKKLTEKINRRSLSNVISDLA